MAKKIFSVVLKELEVVEIEGEYKEVYKNEKKYPLFLTNLSLSRGRDQGLLDSSMLSDVLQMKKTFEGKKNQEEAAQDTIQDLSEEKMLHVIYLAFLGANPHTEYSYEDFLALYHDDYIQTLTLYMQLVASSITDGDNKFANGLKNSTKKPSSKEKK